MARHLAITRLACALVGVALLPVLAVAADWEPLGIGSRWEYRGVAGAHQVITVTGNRLLHGRVVAVKSYAEAPDQGLENYWLLDADGSLLLAGFLDVDGAFGLVYEPPIRYLPVPPSVGPKPPQLVEAHDFFTDEVLFADPLEFDVTEEVTLPLNAGTFHAFGVGQLIPVALRGLDKGQMRTLDGRKLPANYASIYEKYTTDWYSEGVGSVQYDTVDLYQLAAYGLPTPVAHSTWGEIKRLYR